MCEILNAILTPLAGLIGVGVGYFIQRQHRKEEVADLKTAWRRDQLKRLLAKMAECIGEFIWLRTEIKAQKQTGQKPDSDRRKDMTNRVLVPVAQARIMLLADEDPTLGELGEDLDQAALKLIGGETADKPDPAGDALMVCIRIEERVNRLLKETFK